MPLTAGDAIKLTKAAVDRLEYFTTTAGSEMRGRVRMAIADAQGVNRLAVLNVDLAHFGNEVPQAEVVAFAAELRAEGYQVLPGPLQKKIFVIFT